MQKFASEALIRKQFSWYLKYEWLSVTVTNYFAAMVTLIFAFQSIPLVISLCSSDINRQKSVAIFHRFEVISKINDTQGKIDNFNKKIENRRKENENGIEFRVFLLFFGSKISIFERK